MGKTPYKDVELSDDEILVRRVPSDAYKPHATTSASAVERITSNCYSSSSASRDPHMGCSCDLKSILSETGLDPATESYAPNVRGLVGVRVADVRSLGLWVGRDPVDGNPAHVSIWEMDAHGKSIRMKASSQAKILGKSFVIRPTDGSVVIAA